MAIGNVLGSLLGLVAGFLVLAWLIQLSAEKFLKKNKKKGDMDFTKYNDACKIAGLVVLISLALRLFFLGPVMSIIRDIFILAALTGLYRKYYHFKKWYKPFLIVVGIFVAFGVFSFLVALLGFAFFR